MRDRVTAAATSRETETTLEDPHIRAWREFINHCEKKEKKGKVSLGFIRSLCSKYDVLDDTIYVTGKHILGIVRQATISIFRTLTPIESFEKRMNVLSNIRMTPFSMVRCFFFYFVFLFLFLFLSSIDTINLTYINFFLHGLFFSSFNKTVTD